MFASFFLFFSKPPLKYRTESRWLERSVEGDRSKESRTSVLEGGQGLTTAGRLDPHKGQTVRQVV